MNDALVFLSAAVILVPIFQRLGFGSVLGYLIAGVVVGPYGFKLIHDAQSIVHFSELGVVLLLFVIGLEIQPRKLWSMRRHLLGLGGIQALLCSIAFMACAWLAGLPPVTAGVIGFALSLSSTAFAVQTLVEKNLFSTEFGRSSFSILLMQDLLAIPALAIIPSLAPGAKLSETPWSQVALGLGTIATLVIVGRYLTRPVFRMIASIHNREVFTAVTLFIVIGVAALMQKVGLSAALGAFIAGVLLAESEYRHELEANIEPFKGLLMGLFFIAVGMGVRLDVVMAKPALVFGLAIGYLAVKSVLIYLVGLWYKLGHGNSKRMALTIAQGGEFAFVIFGMAMSLSLVDSETLAVLTAVITLSMALNPLLIIADEKMADYRQRKIQPEYDKIDGEEPAVIIAGLGRFGQIFSRILRAQDIPFVAIDHDATQIEQLRKFGNKVYYGDATRRDLLEMAGAAKAKYFVLAIDDPEASVKSAEMVKENFPHIKIYARARNRGHSFELMDLGIMTIKRETLDSATNFAGDLLVDLGFEPAIAKRIVEKFREHDILMLHEQHKVHRDDDNLISVSRQGAAQFAQVLQDEVMQSRISTSATPPPDDGPTP